MTESYKLTYFNLKAVGEPIRLIFAYAGVKYEDNRIPIEGWADIKNNYPYGQLPVLQAGTEILAQSNAICRYLGKKFNLHGSNDWEAANIDEIADAITDFRQQYDPIRREQDQTKSASLKQTFVDNVVSKYFGKMEARISKNEGSPYLVGKAISWVDLMVVNYMEVFEALLPEYPNMLAAYPNLQNLRKTVLDIPRIREWVEKRPQTPL